jgi:hypothetical protein
MSATASTASFSNLPLVCFCKYVRACVFVHVFLQAYQWLLLVVSCDCAVMEGATHSFNSQHHNLFPQLFACMYACAGLPGAALVLGEP